MRNRVMFIIVIMCMLSFLVGAAVDQGNCAEVINGVSVIGKANIKKGTELMGFVPVNDKAVTNFTFVAAENTTIYLTKKVGPVAGEHDGGYVGVADGFPHQCPTHGLETMGPGRVIIRQNAIDMGDVEVILFEMATPGKGANSGS